MVERTRAEMDAVAINDFLADRQTGILSMADGDDAYGIPVSFDYDPDERAMYFRFGFGPQSEKRRFLESSDTASFAVYDRGAAGWQSVVAEGHLEQVTESNLDSSVLEAIDDLDIPYFQVHRRPAGDMDFSIVRLNVTTLSGIAEQA